MRTQENATMEELLREVKVTCSQTCEVRAGLLYNGKWEVYVDGIKIKSGRNTWFSRKYIISDNKNPEKIAGDAVLAALQKGIQATHVYIAMPKR